MQTSGLFMGPPAPARLACAPATQPVSLNHLAAERRVKSITEKAEWAHWQLKEVSLSL